MARFLSAAALSLTIAFAGPALAQSAGAQGGMATQHNPDQPGMADTSSDSGNMGTGASSSKIGTGTQSHGAVGTGSQNEGVMGPEAPGTTGQGATGANANSSSGTNQ
jgi:hypothetical protein